jgi:hypothetical protein
MTKPSLVRDEEMPYNLKATGGQDESIYISARISEPERQRGCRKTSLALGLRRSISL